MYRVLVVDDDPMNYEMAKLHLGKLGFTIDSAPDGAVAVALVSANTYDLILMDIQMPVMDGLEATRKMRLLPHCAGLTILAATANPEQKMRQTCMDVGMTGFITKPFTGAAFLEAVLQWIEPARQGGTHALEQRT